jgi:hypothetical protein
MAKMLPPYIDKSCKSSAERKIFSLLKESSFTDDWTVLHSLNLSQHSKRLYGEIDFLLLIPGGGIFVLEVKGGNVKQSDGVWYYTNRHNRTFKNDLGPFNQARDAMFSLRNSIVKEFGKNHKFSHLLFGFFAAFPDVPFDRHSVEYESWQIFDKDILETGCEPFFKNLIHNFQNKYKTQKWFSNKSLPDSEVINELLDYLRGDFERIRTISDYLNDFDQRVKSYTQEQFRILDSIQVNERSLIQGSAGTGKTMIAVESAIRHATEGKSVLVSCFNKRISEWMKKQLMEWSDRITVTHLHGFLFEASQGFNYAFSKINANDFYTEYLPELVKDMYSKNILNKYEVLIIDEGQDLIRSGYLELFNELLFGGLTDGKWEIYGDFEKQAIYSQISKHEMLKQLDEYAYYSNFRLKINCRNTKQIGEETSIISGFEKPPFLLEYLESVPVEYSFYKDKKHQAKIVNKKLIQLISEELSIKDLTILSPRKLENSCCSSITEIEITDNNKSDGLSKSSQPIQFATIQSFKGLENNYIIITDIDDIDSEKAQALLYVGMTRAKYSLVIFISETERDVYKKLLKNKLLKNA